MEIRDATIDDYDAYARLFRELGVDDPTPTRERFGTELAPRAIVAVEHGAVVGYALADRMQQIGYVRNIVTDSAHRRHGVGRAVMEALRARFRAAGATTWCLNVKPDNAAAVTLYERCGMALAYRAYLLRLPRDVAPPPIAHEVALLPPEADAALEPRLHLYPGQLAAVRGRAGREILGLSREGELVGAAMFMAAIPGAFPFRVVEPSLGPPFLGHLCARAEAGKPWVQVGIEDDEPLCDAILAVGAYVALETVHMRGPI